MMDSAFGADSRDGKIYYGWVVVAIGFIVWTLAFGIQYSFGIFFKPLQETFEWSRATTSWAITLHSLVYGLGNFPAGWAIDRFKGRTIYSLAAVLIGASLVLASRVSQPWQLYLLYGLPLAIGLSFCGSIFLIIITRWFTRQRGLALGIASSGAGFGTLTVAPLSNWLISTHGWRYAFTAMGVASFIILLVCAYFIRTTPPPANRKGPDVAVSGSTGPVKAPGMTFREAVKTRDLLLITLALISFNFALRMILVHLAPHATDTGISPSVAALAVGTIGGCSILGRVVMGFFQDRIGPRRSIVLCIVPQGVALLALPFIRSDLLFFVFAVIFGFTYGGDVPQMPAITAQCFGVAAMGAIYGLITAIGNSGGGGMGPIVAGYIFDLTGSYTAAFLLAAAGLFGGVFCIWKIRLTGTATPEKLTGHRPSLPKRSEK